MDGCYEIAIAMLNGEAVTIPASLMKKASTPRVSWERISTRGLRIYDRV